MKPTPPRAPSGIQSNGGTPPPTLENTLDEEATPQVDASVGIASVRDAAADLRSAGPKLDTAVLHARSAGRSWSKIGAAAGMSRQSAHNRWSTKQ